MVRIARLDDAFLAIFELEASPVGDQSLQQKRSEKERWKKIKNPKSLET